MFPLSISKDEVMQFPLRHYEGKIAVASTEEQIEEAMREINQHGVVGFDTEAKPTFKKGQVRNIGLIQVATEQKVYLLRTHQLGYNG